MIGQRRAFEVPHFDALVAHLDTFAPHQRRALAARCDADSETSEAIARRWCVAPETLRDSVRACMTSAHLRTLIEDLVLDHDLPVGVAWAGRKSLRQLVDLGLLPPDAGRGEERAAQLPGVVAAILAPLVSGVRPSLPILLGRMEHEGVTHLADLYGIPAGPHMLLILEIIDYFLTPGIGEAILAELPEPDWLGGALMAIELGGMCYWQEVFGAELDDPLTPHDDDGGKVVPLMREVDRRQERDIAQTLMELGVVFRLEGDDLEYPMLAVPEELWHAIWSIGRNWLMDWVANSFATLEEGAIKRPFDFPRDDTLLERLKWLGCEVAQREISVPLPEAEAEHLASISALTTRQCRQAVSLGVEIGVFEHDRRGVLSTDAEQLATLDAPHQSFARRMLRKWTMGLIGSSSERFVSQAIGLDEQWRGQVLGMELELLDDRLPAWLFHEGVDSQVTGAGYLRSLEVSTPQLLTFELGMVGSYLCCLKILWLDILSLLDDRRWYSLGAIQELLQLSAGLTLFSHLAHVLEHPSLTHYLPVQRASFLTDPVHTSAFDRWAEAIIHEVLEPLGVAHLDEELVWLDTRPMRIANPLGMFDEQRVVVIREILNDPEFAFTIPNGSGNGLRSITTIPDPEEGAIALEAPMASILDAVDGRRIVRYDGSQIFTAPTS